MAKSLREEFGEVSEHLRGFRNEVGRLDASGTPGLPTLLAELLRAFDDATADMHKLVPGALNQLEQDIAGVEKLNAELTDQLAAAQRKLAEPAAVAVIAAKPTLPRGHGQTLRSELLARFAEAGKPTAPASSGGDVHDLASGDWKDSGTAVPPTPPARPAETPGKPRGHDVGDMNTRDWH